MSVLQTTAVNLSLSMYAVYVRADVDYLLVRFSLRFGLENHLKIVEMGSTT